VRHLLAQGVLCEQIFIDTAISGTMPASDRLGFRALLEYVRSHEHEITTLYVFEISRIGRLFLETLDVVRRLEEECGIIVWSLSPNYSSYYPLLYSCRSLTYRVGISE
jgi:DNA invertase Pin-like site-specific DNA recombinase